MDSYTPNNMPPIPEDAYRRRQANFNMDSHYYLTYSFGLMGVGLCLTALVSFLVLATGFYNVIFSNGFLSTILLLVQFGLAIGLGVAMNRASASTLLAMFIAYSCVTGITFSTLGLVYAGSTLFYAFLITAVYYFCLAFVGMTTKRNLTNIGMFALVGLIVLVISQIVLMLFRAPMNVHLYSALGLIVFTGITMWDVQRMKMILMQIEGDDLTAKKWAVYFALELYLDFINIFLYILRLIGIGSSSSND